MAQLLKVIPLGGLGEIGLNMMAIEYDGKIIVVDAGLMFPKEDMLGVDLVIPDITYLVERASQVQAILLTHGHEDHIGALPFVINRLNVPIYGTRMTLGLVKNKLKEHRLLANATLHEVKPGDVVNLPPFSIEYIHIAHSIPDCHRAGDHHARRRRPALGRLQAGPDPGRRSPHRHVAAGRVRPGRGPALPFGLDQRRDGRPHAL